MNENPLTPHDDELDIMNAPITITDGMADDSDAIPDDASATLLGAAGATIRALAADDTDNDG